MPSQKEQTKLQTFAHACKFCGQAILTDKEFTSAEEAIEDATMECKCFDAHRYQQRTTNIAKLTNAIKQIAEYCENHEIKLDEDIPQILLFNGVAIIDYKISKVSIDIGNKKVAISTNAKGNIIIKFTYADCLKLEV